MCWTKFNKAQLKYSDGFLEKCSFDVVCLGSSWEEANSEPGWGVPGAEGMCECLLPMALSPVFPDSVMHFEPLWFLLSCPSGCSGALGKAIASVGCKRLPEVADFLLNWDVFWTCRWWAIKLPIKHRTACQAGLLAEVWISPALFFNVPWCVVTCGPAAFWQDLVPRTEYN